MQGCFSAVRQGQIRICAVLDEELAEPPVPVEGCGVETEIVSQRWQCFAVRKQEFYGTDIAVVCTPIDERRSFFVLGGCGMPSSDVVEHEVGTAVCDAINHVCPPCALADRSERALG